MKKNLLLLAALLCCTAVLTSCGGDDDPKEKTTATAVYNITFTQDLIDAASPIIIYYKGTNNETKREIITGTSWSKTITSEKFPAEFGYKLDAQSKDVSDLTKDNYELGFSSNIAISVAEGSSVIATRVASDESTTSTAKDRVSSVVSRSINNRDLGIKVTKDGTINTGASLSYTTK